MAQLKYTNRRGQTFYLHARQRRDGRSTYVFAREPGDGPVSATPAGYEIVESIHGNVSLRKKKARPITDDEIDVVRDVLAGHPHLALCKADHKGKTIEVYEPRGALPEATGFEAPFAVYLGLRNTVQQPVDIAYWAQMRFVLVDRKTRQFRVERMCYKSWKDGWLTLETDTLSELAEKYLPHLRRDSFFELWPY